MTDYSLILALALSISQISNLISQRDPQITQITQILVMSYGLTAVKAPGPNESSNSG